MKIDGRTSMKITCNLSSRRPGYLGTLSSFSMARGDGGAGLYMYVRMNVCMDMYSHIYKHICIYICIYIYMYVCILRYISTRIHNYVLI